MWMKLAITAVLLAAPTTSPRGADQHPASPQQIARARTAADRILVEGAATDLFENVTDGDTPTVRHKASGLTCAFSGTGRDDYVRVLPATPGGPPFGDDVACGTRLASTVMTFYATRYPNHPGLEEVFRSTVAVAAAGHSDARRYDGAVPTVTMAHRPTPRTAAITMMTSGRRVLSLIFAAQAGDWSFKGVATAPAGDGMAVIIAPMRFAQALPEERPTAPDGAVAEGS